MRMKLWRRTKNLKGLVMIAKRTLYVRLQNLKKWNPLVQFIYLLVWIRIMREKLKAAKGKWMTKR